MHLKKALSFILIYIGNKQKIKKWKKVKIGIENKKNTCIISNRWQQQVNKLSFKKIKKVKILVDTEMRCML